MPSPAWYVFSEPSGVSLVEEQLPPRQEFLEQAGLPLAKQIVAMAGWFPVMTIKSSLVFEKEVPAKSVVQHLVDHGQEVDDDYVIAYIPPGGLAAFRAKLVGRLRLRKHAGLPGGKPGAVYSCCRGEQLTQVFLGLAPLPQVGAAN